MIVALAALEEGIITKDTKVYCSGRMQLGNHFFHCWKKYGHGAVNVVEALQHSCDIFFYDIAQRLGIEKIAAMFTRRGGCFDVLNPIGTADQEWILPVIVKD